MRYIITFLAFLFFVNSNAQSDKTWIVSTQVGFFYKKNMNEYDNGAFSPASFTPYYDISRSFSNRIYIGKKIGKNLNVGAGVELNLIKNQAENEEYLYTNNLFTGIRTTINVNKTNRYSPFIFFEYNQTIGSRFYLVAKAHFQYDLYKLNNSREVTEGSDYSEFNEEQNQHYMTIGLQPALRYDLFERFGIELNFGKIEHSTQTMNSEENINDTEPNKLEINFKPNNWLIGVYFRF